MRPLIYGGRMLTREAEMEKFGWAFIGAGRMARKAAAEVTAEGSCRICSVWSRREESSSSFAARYGCAAYDSVEGALTAEGVRGAYISLVNSAHAQYIKECVDLGVPVLCEKPFTLSERQSEEAFAYAKERGIYLCEAMWTWFNPVAQKVKEWVRSRRIGKIRSVEATYAFPLVKMSSNPRLVRRELGGGALLDIGVYPVRYIYELFGMPSAVDCGGATSGGVDLEENIVFDYGSFTAKIYVSMVRYHGERLIIRGDGGVIKVNGFHAARRAVCRGAEGREVFRDGGLLYARQFARAAEEIYSGALSSSVIPPQGTLDVMGIMDECRRQLGVVYPGE